MTHHVRRGHAFGGFGVMRATGGVNVMIARPPAALGRINPAFHLEGRGRGMAFYNERPFLDDGFRSARKFHRILSGGQLERLTVAAIDLRMKREIGREPLVWRGIDAVGAIAQQKTAGGWLVLL